MGFHIIDILIIAAIGLAIFGPKALQSMSRAAGRGAGQLTNVKDKLMSDLPIDEITKVKESIPQVPLNPQQAVQMILSTDKKESEARAKQEPEKKDDQPKSEQSA